MNPINLNEQTSLNKEIQEGAGIFLQVLLPPQLITQIHHP